MYCPKCSGEMGMRDVRCPHCGYDFNEIAKDAGERRAGFAYSWFAYFVLVLAIVVVVIGCLGLASYLIIAPLFSDHMRSDDWLGGAMRLFAGLVLLVVLLRVFDVRPRT
ncbi:MAG: hypothetical protein WD875_04065 [Pirellulales bacterium]